MQASEGGSSLQILRPMTEQAGLHLDDEELAEMQHIYDPTQVAGLRALNLQTLEPASIFVPA